MCVSFSLLYFFFFFYLLSVCLSLGVTQPVTAPPLSFAALLSPPQRKSSLCRCVVTTSESCFWRWGVGGGGDHHANSTAGMVMLARWKTACEPGAGAVFSPKNVNHQPHLPSSAEQRVGKDIRVHPVCICIYVYACTQKGVEQTEDNNCAGFCHRARSICKFLPRSPAFSL